MIIKVYIHQKEAIMKETVKKAQVRKEITMKRQKASLDVVSFNDSFS